MLGHKSDKNEEQIVFLRLGREKNALLWPLSYHKETIRPGWWGSRTWFWWRKNRFIRFLSVMNWSGFKLISSGMLWTFSRPNVCVISAFSCFYLYHFHFKMQTNWVNMRTWNPEPGKEKMVWNSISLVVWKENLSRFHSVMIMGHTCVCIKSGNVSLLKDDGNQIKCRKMNSEINEEVALLCCRLDKIQ